MQSARPVKNGGWFHRLTRRGGRSPARRRRGGSRRRSTPPRCTAPGWPATTPEALAEFAASLGVSARVVGGGRRGLGAAARGVGVSDVRRLRERGRHPAAQRARQVRRARQPAGHLPGRGARAEDAVRLRRAPPTPPRPSSWACSPWAGPNCCCGGLEIQRLRAPARVRPGRHRLRQRQARPGRRAQGRRRAEAAVRRLCAAGEGPAGICAAWAARGP